ncbi:MAG: ATP-dependent DNA helicase RecG, partial [Actinomycetes bacterium]
MSETATMDTPLKKLVGDKTAKALASHLDLHTAGDLVYHFPRRYDERGEHTDIRSLEVGEQVTVLGQVQRTAVRPMRQRRGNLLEVTVGDGSGGLLTLTFFGNQAWRERELRPGRWGLFAGKVTEFRGKRQLNGPEYVLLGEGAADGEAAASEEIEEFAGALIPVYPAAAAVPTWVIARCVRVVLDTLTPPEDPLPASVRAGRNLIRLDAALREIHRPSTKEDLYRARHRLKWDEAFALQLTLVQRKHRAASWPARPRPRRDDGLLAVFDDRLPYELTGGQRDVGEEVAADLATAHPMHRLLQGEVGSGKTVVALRAMLTVIDAGGQAALLAPTEVLAVQHERSLRALLGPLGTAGELGCADEATRIVLLTGSQSAPARRAALAAIAERETGIVVGTHALLSEGTSFAELGLVVVDEQHRFGVEQRDTLRARAEASGGTPPHLLVMTATPIPRTVAMTVFGDLDTSELTELPAGRTPIRSHVAPPQWHTRIWAKVREEVQAGHQAFVVCPRIGEGPEVDLDRDDEPADDPDEGADGAPVQERRPPLAVLDVLPLLADGELAGLRIEALHGRLPAEDKERVMSRFTAGHIDVLVATTMVEVGVDVPNATVMVILDADRFGVSQLHQLRGRVGRGSAAGWCLLHTDAPEGSPSRLRVDAVAATLD